MILQNYNMPFKATQSASRVKTAMSCSWLYYAKYILKIPDPSNTGALLGDAAHRILECLAHPKRRELVGQIIQESDIFCYPPLRRLTYNIARHNEVDTPELVQKIKDFVLSGLSYDFYGEQHGKPVVALTEKDFLLDEPIYKVRGFIDRLFVYRDGTAIIRDYKSSKECYKGDDASTLNLQASFYALAVKKMSERGEIPPVSNIRVQFLFLKFDLSQESEWCIGECRGKPTKKQYHNGGGRIEISFSDEEIAGFEFEVEDFQKYIENFDEQKARGNFAFDQGMPPDEEGFCGKLLCGFNSVPGELKKDGTLKWGCSAKFEFPYYQISQNGEYKASCFIDEREKFLTKYPVGDYTWVEHFYSGCPKFRQPSP